MPGTWNNAALDAFEAHLVALWDLEDAGPGMADRLYGLDFTDEGGVTSYQQAGVRDYAVDIPTGQYIYTAAGDRLPAGDFTIACWVQRRAATCQVLNTDSGADITLSATRVAWREFGADVGGANTAIDPDTWYHLAVVSEGGVLAVYLNGAALTASGTVLAVLQGGVLYLSGDVKLDQLAVWSVALSPAAVANLYNGGVGRDWEPGLVRPVRCYRGVRARHAPHTRHLDTALQVVPLPLDVHADMIRPRVYHGVRARHRARSRIVAPQLIDYDVRQTALRGRYRILTTPGYRIYRSSTGPPLETDPPLISGVAALPYTIANPFTTGTWWISLSYYNGVLDSGFLPIGANGETYVRLDVADSGAVTGPPAAPQAWLAAAVVGGAVRVTGLYLEEGAQRATEWAIGYTTDGSEPAADAPAVTEAIGAAGLAILERDLPAQAEGTTVKVRLQVRRAVTGGYSYSEGSSVQTVTARADGPTTPPTGDAWPGLLADGQ